MSSRRNYKGIHSYKYGVPAWLQVVGTKFGDAITYVLIGTIMQLRLFVAACVDVLTTEFRYQQPRVRTMPLLALASTVNTNAPVEV